MRQQFLPVRVVPVFAVSLFALGAGLFAQTPIRHIPPETRSPNLPLILKAESAERLDWLMAFWKTPAAEGDESLSFETTDGKSFIGRLDPASLNSQILTYYLAYKAGGQVHYLPEGAPDSIFTVEAPISTGAQAAVTPPPPPAGPFPTPRPFPFRLDGTLETTVVESDNPAPTKLLNSQNLRLDYSGHSDKAEWTIGARLGYNNHPFLGENSFDLPELTLAAKFGEHSLQAGDLSVSESEFSIVSSGRRGFVYGFKAAKFEVRAFTLSTQVLRGFKGVGLPKSGAALFGGAAGASPWKGFTLKAVFVSGEDDPALGYNIGISSIFRRRKGRVLSFIAESALFQDAIRLQGEYSLSHYDGDLTDGEALVPGQAFRLQGTLRRGIFDVQVGYRSVGKDFNTVGLPFLLNDRRGFRGTAGLSFGRFRLGGGYRTEETNVDEDPDIATARLTSGQGEASLGFGRSSSIRFGYSQETQDARFSTGVWNAYPAFQGTLTKTGITGGLDLGLSTGIRLSLSGEKGTLRCDQTPAMNGDLTTASFVVQILLPERLMIFPVFSYTRILPSSGADTQSMTLSLNGELTLVPKWLTWNVTAALSDLTTGSAEPMKTMFADSGINLKLKPLISLGDLIVSLRGQYMRTRISGLITNDARATVRLTHAF